MAMQYSNEARIAAPDVYEPLIVAVSRFAFPLLPLSCIKRGWQNRTSLPAGTNEYCLVSVLDRFRIGTNERSYVRPKATASGSLGTMAEKTLWEAQAQVSFFSSHYLAEARAESFKSFMRGFLGGSFFRQYGIGAGYCDDIRIMDFEDGSKMQLQHAMLYVHLQYWSGLEASLPFSGETLGVTLHPLT